MESKKKKMFKYVGVLQPNICEKWGIEEHRNKPILVYENRKYHVEDRHLQEFGSKEEIDRIYDMLDVIIKKPDYVFYNSENKGLEYYKNVGYDTCAAVEIKPEKVLKVKSWYPANEGKIANRKKKEEEIFEKNIYE